MNPISATIDANVASPLPGYGGGSGYSQTMLYDPTFAYYYSYYCNSINQPYYSEVGDYRKASKRPLADMQWTCEPCSKKFAVQSQYAAHIAMHIKCEVSGCNYSASKRLVLAHKRETHSELTPDDRQIKDNKSEDDESCSEKNDVLQDLISFKPVSNVVESAEEVAKWLKDRKKNFPTSSQQTAELSHKERLLERGGHLPPATINQSDLRKRKSGPVSVLQGHAIAESYGNVKRRPLLRLLLERERFQEKNIVLQCIRHIVEKHEL